MCAFGAFMVFVSSFRRLAGYVVIWLTFGRLLANTIIHEVESWFMQKKWWKWRVESWKRSYRSLCVHCDAVEVHICLLRRSGCSCTSNFLSSEFWLRSSGRNRGSLRRSDQASQQRQVVGHDCAAVVGLYESTAPQSPLLHAKICQWYLAAPQWMACTIPLRRSHPCCIRREFQWYLAATQWRPLHDHCAAVGGWSTKVNGRLKALFFKRYKYKP